MRFLLQPRSVALVGPVHEPNSPAARLLKNLRGGSFRGKIFVVGEEAVGAAEEPTFKRLADLPAAPDLVLIALPTAAVPDVLTACGEMGARAVVICGVGQRDPNDPQLQRLERAIRQTVRQYNLRVLGPNSLGVMVPPLGLNATSTQQQPLKGNIAFISQSAALCEAILDRSQQENIGFSAFVSLGGMFDVSWGDLISYLSDDAQTHAILLYMESVGNARQFISAAREASYNKPIIVIKPGRGREALRLAGASMGTVLDPDAVYEAAFRRSGVLRVNTIGELFYMASALDKQPPAQGKRLAIITNSSGPAGLAADALLNGGGQLARLSRQTTERLRAIEKRGTWRYQNPLDIDGSASPEMFRQALEIVNEDPENDGVLVIFAPQASADPRRTAELICDYRMAKRKPLLVSFMGASQVADANELFNQAGIPTFLYPDSGARVFNYMWRYRYNVRGIYETPRVPEAYEQFPPDRHRAEVIIESIREQGRSVLNELESKIVLDCYRLPVVDTRFAASAQEAIRQADSIGYPVALKVCSELIVRKQQARGVYLNLNGPTAVRDAFKQIKTKITERYGPEYFDGVTVQAMFFHQGLDAVLGSKIDPDFGPVILFGNGGRIVELYNDKVIALPPLNSTLAQRAMEQTLIYHAGQRLVPDAEDLAQRTAEMVTQFSQLVVDHPQIKEIELNPVAISQKGLRILDARITLHTPDFPEADLVPLAIRPYPLEYELDWHLRDGRPVRLRPIRAEDEPRIVRFHDSLSDDTVYMRFFYKFSYHKRTSHERLARICFVDYDRQMTLVAEMRDAEQYGRIVGAIQLFHQRNNEEAEFAMLVSDDMQGQGLGRKMLSEIVRIGEHEGLARITAEILPGNTPMKKLAQHLGFRLTTDFDEGIVRGVLELATKASAAV